jgi:hypothetical protein
MFFNEETENEIDALAEEFLEAVRDERLLFFEGCVVVTAPVGAPPEYITVMVDGINDPNVHWRGVPGGLTVGDVVLVWHNPVSDRREIIGASGAAGAATPFVHDHRDVVQGGPDLNPETFSPQTFIVGPAPCSYPTLGAAVVAVNAFGPAAATPCTIRVQGILTAEAGDVTIPRYCHVEGVGPGSTIGMGANTLILSSDTSMTDIDITSSDPVDALRTVNVDNVFLTNVRVVQSVAAICFNFTGTSIIECFECIAEATLYGATGFEFSGTSSGHLFHCYCVNVMYFAIALNVTSTGIAGVWTRYCAFRAPTAGNDVVTGAGSHWYHLACHFDPTNVTLAAGTHYARPTKRFNQEVIVAERGGDFQALSEAVTYVNAQGDAAADNLYGVFMLAGNFAEAAGVTIPQYVHVCGQGRGTEIEMGNNVLALSDDSSLKDVVVETTMDASIAYCVECNGATGYELFNVLVRYTPHTSGANVGFYFHGASDGAAYHCVAEPLAGSATGTVTGFAADDSAVVLLWDCEANDTTNLDDGLYVGDTADVTTKHCAFRADVDDVEVVATASWSHISTEASPSNVTLPGTIAFLPRLRDEIGCAAWSNANRLVGTGAWTAAIFSGVRWDDALDMGLATAFWAAGAPTRITIPVGLDGRYNIYAHAVFDASGAGVGRYIRILLNGATNIGGTRWPFCAAQQTWMHVSTVYDLVAGDFLEMEVFQDTGGNLNLITAAQYGIEFRIESK